MPIFASLLALASVAPQVSDDLIDTLTLAGRKVEVRVPRAAQGGVPAHIVWQGMKYAVLPSGQVARAFREDDPWREAVRKYRLAQARMDSSSAVWRVKAILLSRADTVEPMPNGLVRQIRVGLETQGIQGSLQRLGLLKVLLEGMAGGALRVEIDAEIEDEPVRFGEGVGGFAGEMDRMVRARTNQGEFAAEDKVDRGPWDQIVVFHPLPVDLGRKANVVPHAFFLHPWAGQAAEQLADASRSLMAEQLRRAGYPSGIQASRLGDNLVEADWKRLGVRKPLDRAQFLRIAGTASKTPKPFRAEITDPRAELPVSAAPAAEGRRVIAVPVQFASFYLAHLPESARPRMDMLTPEGELRLEIAATDNVLADLGWEGKIVPGTAPAAPLPTDNVAWTREGDAWRYVEEGAVRYGKAPLTLPGEGRFLTFRARSSGREPLAIHVRSRSGTIREVPLPPLASEWQPVTVDLGSEEVAEAWIGPPSDVFVRTQVEAVVAEFQGIAVSAAGQPTSVPGAPAANPDGTVEEKLAFLVARIGQPVDDTLVRLARDGNAKVQLNAIRLLSRSPRATDIDTLAQLAANVNYWVARYALDGLANLGTSEARRALLAAAASGPMEANRGYAASLLDPKGADSGVPTLISRLFAARSWRAREDAVRALGKFGTPQSQVILISFLLDPEPLVRLAVVESADPKNELVARRLQWTAVNDSSDEVRAQTLIKLVRSGIPSLEEEGRRGVRDESRYVRLQVLAELEGEASRGAFRLAVADADPEIRALALAKFRALGEVSAAEIETALNDPHPMVQRELIELLTARPALRTDAVLARLRASVDPDVARRAKDL
jgi:HEAT repeat protein